uniref:Uncharacterized protein n=1 Tax=Micrurus lemniscatus lemniscatus TaxID=129467 RepID=A0A2D4JHQ0_MICLE
MKGVKSTHPSRCNKYLLLSWIQSRLRVKFQLLAKQQQPDRDCSVCRDYFFSSLFLTTTWVFVLHGADKNTIFPKPSSIQLDASGFILSNLLQDKCSFVKPQRVA